MAKRNKNEKKVQVEFTRGFRTELYQDVAESYAAKGKLKILGNAKEAPAAKETAKEPAKG